MLTEHRQSMASRQPMKDRCALVESCNGLAVTMAVAHPCDRESLLGTVEAAHSRLLINPTQDDKRDIVQSAIDQTHVLGIAAPKVNGVLNSHSGKDDTRKAPSAMTVKKIHARLKQSHCLTLPGDVLVA